MDERSLENYKFWESYPMYVDLMQAFVDRKITGKKFSDKFFQMWKFNLTKTYSAEKLVWITKNIQLTEIDGFSSLISNLFLDCEVFEDDPLLRDKYAISEEELRDCVKKTLLKIKQRYS